MNGFEGSTIGIIGFGHLGHSLALPLVANGFPKNRLMISHGESASTHERAISLGFGECLADSSAIMESADIAVVAVRPQDALLLPCREHGRGLVISCMAGLPLELLRVIFRGNVARMMCSGPDTILSGRGVAVAYASENLPDWFLPLMGMRVMKVGSEEELDAFTIGICIPAMLQNIELGEEDVSGGIESMRSRYPVYGPLGDWIREVAPGRSGDGTANLQNVSTKGGVTEAMMTALLSGASFEGALNRGLERGREITAEIGNKALGSIRLAV
jgi:pyrroline-5-carboxylate reductase